MTAEIAVMNASGVALAADSAASIATSQNTKIYNANKLFMLSKYQPVGVMLYGGAEFMGIPWETIIKIYRKELKSTLYRTLQEYGDNFINFLNNNTYLFPEKEQENHVYKVTYGGFVGIKRQIDNTVEAETHKGVKISGSQIEEITKQSVQAVFAFMQSRPLLVTLPASFEKDVFGKYLTIIDQAIGDVFQTHPLPTVTRKQLRRIGASLFARDMFNVRDERRRQIIGSSGIVIAGFGEGDLLPSILSYEMEGVVSNTLKYKEGAKGGIDSENTAAVYPFAQREMVDTFMEGVAPNFKQALDGYLKTIFDKYPEELTKRFPHLTDAEKADLTKDLRRVGSNLVSTFWDAVNKWAEANNVNPILDTVAVLPIDELASMAESLVNLTSFKRRVTLVAETVGGPIDVAVISKGDGFIWIKRKHYFDPTANPHFFKNYYR